MRPFAPPLKRYNFFGTSMTSDMSRTFKKLGIPHAIGSYESVERVISSHFGVSEEAVQRTIDIENRIESFENIAKWIEECRIVVVDEACGTIQLYGECARPRRKLIISMENEFGAVIMLNSFVESSFFYAIGKKQRRLNITQTCCACYAMAFCWGVFVGIAGFVYGVNEMIGGEVKSIGVVFPGNTSLLNFMRDRLNNVHV